MDSSSHYEPLKTVFENDTIEVYQARDLVTKEKVLIKAAKSLRPSMQLLASFRHEFQINHSLDIKGLVHCQKLIHQHNANQLIYDFVAGESLDQFCKNKPLNLVDFFPIALGIIRALAELHAHHVIHKDIKPENILINFKTLSIKLLDLSLASQLSVEHQEVRSVNQLEGSLAYMAPEQTGRINLPVDYRSDYYELGITFYKLLTGTLPFISADALGYVHCHLAAEAKPVAELNPAIPEMLSAMVAKMMAKSPSARYQSAIGLLSDLERCYTQWQVAGTVARFALGECEVLDTLNLSSKIYGREQEVSTMLESFERVKLGQVEGLLVSGYSGIGKTTVINELQRPITMGRGQYISGKFDLLQRTTPYSAFTTAFVKLVRHWLTETEEQLAQRRTQLYQVFGQNAQVIIEFLPELELIMGPQPAVERLPPEQEQSRFLYHFQNFIVAIATINEPLVIFIDDLQWIDQGSLMLLDQIITAEDAQSLLFIGAYRDNEVDETHPLMQYIGRWKRADVVIQEVKLAPLTLEHSDLFIADSLRMQDRERHSLSELVFHKTQGNPFFSREFLKECFNEGLLMYSREEMLWHADLKQIEALPGSDNVVELMVSKIIKLPLVNQKLIQLAACVGMNFALDVLAQLSDSTELDVIGGFALCIQEGLIKKESDGLSYRFIHDRIQQAAHQMLSEQEQQQVHLKAGRLLLEQSHSHSKSVVFEILDHFKRCVELIKDVDEKERLANLSLVGGQQALAGGATEAAYDYLSLGLVWLQDFHWDKKYPILWELHFASIETLFLLKKYDQALKSSEFLLHQSKKGIDRAHVYNLILKTYNALGEFKKSFQLVSVALAELNFHLSPKPSKLDVFIEYCKFRWNYGWGKNVIQNTVKLRSPDTDAFRIFSSLAEAGLMAGVFSANPTYILYSVLRLYSFAAIHGANTSMIFQQINAMRTLLLIKEKNYKEYVELWQGEAAFLQDNTFSPSERAEWTNRLMQGAGYMISVHEMMEKMPLIIQTMLETGSYTSLETAINFDLEFSNFADLPLAEFKAKASYYLKIGKKTAMQRITKICEMMLLSAEHLMQHPPRDIAEVIAALPDSTYKPGLLLVFNYYLMEDYRSAQALHAQCKKEKRLVNQSLSLETSIILDVLILAQLQSETSSKNHKRALKKIKRYARKLKAFATLQPKNFLHLSYMIQAELARMESSSLTAMSLYCQAIQTAEKQGFIRWAAIASERLGELYLKEGDTGAASHYFNEAIYFFSQWGSVLKVSLIKEKYGYLLLMKQVDTRSDNESTSASLVRSNLDALTLVKASQAISSEIQLTNLLRVMLITAVENAGAKRGLFVEKIKDKWMVMAAVEGRNGESSFEMPIKVLDEYDDLPHTIIKYVLRSKESLVISHAAEDSDYSLDPYIIRTHSKSLLCLPIIHHHDVIGIMYFENNLVVGAFTQDRVMVLSTLASQIAISLENARHFEGMEQLYRSTERFVPRSFLQLLNKDHVEDVVLGDSVEARITVLFTDIRDYTTLTEKQTPKEAFAFINHYLKAMGPIIRKYGGFINQYQGDAIMAIFPGQADDAVKAVIEMSQELICFNKKLKESGQPEVVVGYGLNTGLGMLGTIGEEERMDANIISDAVNAGSRVESLNKYYGTKFLISDMTYNSLADKTCYLCRIVDKVQVKGKKQILQLYEVVLGEQLDEREQQFIREYEAAFERYVRGEMAEAKALFERCLQIKPGDRSAELFIERCTRFLHEGLPSNWDAVYTQDQK